MFYPSLILTPLCKAVIACGQTRFTFGADEIVGVGHRRCAQELVLKTVLHQF